MQKINPSQRLLMTIRHRLQVSPGPQTRPLHLPAVQPAATAERVPLWRRLLPVLLPLAMTVTIFFMDAVLPLRELGFNNALYPLRGSWIFWPAHLLFPHWRLLPSGGMIGRPPVTQAFLRLSWYESACFIAACLGVLLPYLIALYFLPRRITHRYLLASALLLGLLYLLIPAVTSQDLFQDIGYARTAVLYHLNPLITPPTAISRDPIYSQIYWIHQPSIYGPTWIVPLAVLQWLALKCGLATISPMVLLLRLFGLTVHLGSTQLVWAISGGLQRLQGSFSTFRRKQVALAFAWNPLLLIEACVNVHADILMLFLILLAIWALVRGQERASAARFGGWLCPAVALALASGVKANCTIFVPLLLLYIWKRPQRLRAIPLAAVSYLGTLSILYAPFWSHGAVFKAVSANPSIYRNINSLPEFFDNIYKSVAQLWGPHSTVVTPLSSVVWVTHILSILVFFGAYTCLLWRARSRLRTTFDLVGWMAIAWLLYCFCGAPWFWPWYAVTFLGLFALAASSTGDAKPARAFRFATGPALPLSMSLFTFSLLSIYIFFTWALRSTQIPWLPGFEWAYARGLWTWCVSLFALLVLPQARLLGRQRA